MSKTEIANLAIGHTGSGKEIDDLDTERSQEANACRRYYETARKMCLKEFWWPFCSKEIELALVEESPNDEWSFSYRYPANTLAIRRIVSGNRNDNEDTRVKFKIGRDDTGILIYTDMEDAVAEITFDETDTDRYAEEFKLALSFRLAFLIAPQLTGGDPFKVGDRAWRMYVLESTRAAALAQNEEVSDSRPEADLIRSREY